MHNRITVLIGLALFSVTAAAGLSQPAPVEVDLDFGTAIGDMQSAALDKNPDVLIGCGSRTLDDGAGGVIEFAFCQATDAEGDTIVCATFNPNFVRAVHSISDFSFIQFGVDESGGCDRIGISTQSVYLDKAKN